MSLEQFNEFPSDSRVWIFALATPIEPAAEQKMNSALDEFTSGWKAHGKEVGGRGAVLYRRFIVIAADPSVSEVSGCSIDGMFRNVKTIAQSADAELADFSEVFFRTGERIEGTTRASFKELKRAGTLNSETIVFDNSVSSLELLRGGRWELPLSDSWHSKL